MVGESSAIVKTTVPEGQKERWQAHAEQFGMSQSEFVRTMTQAGLHWFDIESVEHQSPDTNPGGNGLRTNVLDILSNEGHKSFDELAATTTENLEDRLEDTIQSLRNEGLVDLDNRGRLFITGAYDGDD